MPRHLHTLSTVDHNLSECTDCGVRIPGTNPAPLPDCDRPACGSEGLALVGDETLCIGHAVLAIATARAAA